MNFSIEDYVNAAPSSSSIGSIDAFLEEVQFPNPIDSYIENSRSLLSYGTAVRLSENEHLGGLLLLGSVSAAEAYFRSILSVTLETCPICRHVAAEKQINLGGVLWHGPAEFRRSAFEHLSFSSKAELVKAARGYLGFELRDSSFKGPLEQFDIACHLRHGIVHNGGVLPGRNAVQIGARSYSNPVRIAVNFALLQRTIEAVDTLVLTFNRELFGEMCKRWAVDWRQRGDWDSSREEKLFKKIWDSFFCKELNKTRIGRSNITRNRCVTKVRNIYNL
ncbi:hypothetical protein HPDFL43_00036100 [Hoeflea phototrophica DFL-43]|jgi:hypothetical protein|uniref:Uncharacterized protein n=1 Tax=Hoeflea phototrophica (strain DSM 17068 / NCIMB 14078 / DFL-43) TaxID=411684 RepID=A0A094ZYP4_HOEPD|nr:hypothetical protein [Hoeflea phototrophica]KGB27066.1 hypothetical protein HPDFL43_00036100 [Hoeflea phototrophica DFL-43]